MTDSNTPENARRPLRPLYGIPEPERRSRVGWWASVAFHGAILLAILLPPLVATVLMAAQEGAGGPGPAGGGGGGSGGTGGPITPERLTYIHVAPPAPQAETRPQLQPPKPPEPEPPTPDPEETPTPPAAAEAPSVLDAGTGGGSGHDGTAGSGPGTGGGVGSGDGTGRGSGTGPGTGGGAGTIYPPMVTNLPILPDPPRGVRPYTMVAHFEVDETGRAKLLGFNPSSNSGYNRKIREMLAEVRFRPATRLDGTPVRDTTQIMAAYPR